MNFATSDISLAAFLLMRGIRIISAKKEKGKFNFVFEDYENVTNELSQEYIMSEYPRYDASLRQVKRMLYGQ
jgi:hypothetical protein